MPPYLNIQNIFYRIYQFFGGDTAQVESLTGSRFNLGGEYLKFEMLSRAAFYLVSVILFILAIYTLIRIFQIKKKTAFRFVEAVPDELTPGEKYEEWQKIIKNVNSENPSDWKLAVLDADNILDALTKKIGLPGESLGERLMAVNISDFTTLDSAWEAHKVRNRIAHDGASYLLSKREARRVIELFEKVFKEFKMI